MKFLCLVYLEHGALSALSPDEKENLDRDSIAYDKDLERRGHYIVAEALAPVATARTVRVRGGKTSTAEGPVAETKQRLGGFVLIKAANMNEAAGIAAGIPLAKLGIIEVRPIMEF